MTKSSPVPDTLIVIGAHRDELAFGDRVVAGLRSGQYGVLRIPRGLIGQRPRPEELEGYRDRHHALYAQILEHMLPGQRLMIDLHSGIDLQGPCADVLSADAGFLERLRQQRAAHGAGVDPVRYIRLVASTASPDLAQRWPGSVLVAKPDLPEAVWNRRDFLYVGVEVYLREEGKGAPPEWAFACELLEHIVACRPHVN